MIPEIMRGLAYRKGPYFADDGDFASAGSIYLDFADKLILVGFALATVLGDDQAWHGLEQLRDRPVTSQLGPAQRTDAAGGLLLRQQSIGRRQAKL